MKALEEVFAKTMPREMGLGLHGDEFPGEEGAAGDVGAGDLRLFSALRFSDRGGPV